MSKEQPPILIVALSHADAARAAKTEGIRPWTAVTPDNYRDVLRGQARPRTDFWWADITSVFPQDMRDAVAASIRAARGDA